MTSEGKASLASPWKDRDQSWREGVGFGASKAGCAEGSTAEGAGMGRVSGDVAEDEEAFLEEGGDGDGDEDDELTKSQAELVDHRICAATAAPAYRCRAARTAPARAVSIFAR